LGVILIFIWSRFVNLPEIFSIISKVNPLYLAPVFIFLFLSPVLRAVRLKIFLSEIKKIPLKDLIFLNGAAMMLNFFIPIRAGEFVKGFYLNNQHGLPLGKSIIWIFLDRFLDFLVVIILAGAVFALIPTIIILILVLIMIPLLIKKHIKLPFDRFTHFIFDAFSILNRHSRDLFVMVILTILAYGADAGIWYFSFKSLGFDQNFWKMYLGQLLSALTYLVPAAPGYVGSAEASGLLILSGVFGISNNLASAMIVLLHITTAIFVISFGLISVFSLKIDLGAILKKALKRR